MKLGYRIKPRDAKSNPTTAILAAAFVMFLISGLLLLLLILCGASGMAGGMLS